MEKINYIFKAIVGSQAYGTSALCTEYQQYT